MRSQLIGLGQVELGFELGWVGLGRKAAATPCFTYIRNAFFALFKTICLAFFGTWPSFSAGASD